MKILINILDILVVAYIFYRLLLLIRGTRAVQILFGIIFLVLLTIFTKRVLYLPTLNWLLSHFWLTAAVMIAIVFQPEIRSALAHFGTDPIGRLFSAQRLSFIDEIIPALSEFHKKRIGALIVFENDTGLREYIETGTVINGDVTKELLESIFYPKSILHDGAVIIKESRLVSAGCILPVTDKQDISKLFGTRHRAAIGITEVSDALAIVVSEETGAVSLVRRGQVYQDIEVEKLRDQLREIYKVKYKNG